MPQKRSKFDMPRLGEPEDSAKERSSVLRPNGPKTPNNTATLNFVPVGRDSSKLIIPEHNDPGGLRDSKKHVRRSNRSNSIEIMQIIPPQENFTFEKSPLFGKSLTNSKLPAGMNTKILDDKDRKTGLRYLAAIEEGLQEDDDGLVQHLSVRIPPLSRGKHSVHSSFPPKPAKVKHYGSLKNVSWELPAEKRK